MSEAICGSLKKLQRLGSAGPSVVAPQVEKAKLPSPTAVALWQLSLARAPKLTLRTKVPLAALKPETRTQYEAPTVTGTATCEVSGYAVPQYPESSLQAIWLAAVP